MENNKLFKESISNNLYNDVLDHFKKIHNEQQAIQEIDTIVSKKAKIHKAVMYTGGALGLVTIGAAIANGFELCVINQGAIHLGAVGSLAIGAISSKMHRAIESLREDYRKRLADPISMTYVGKFYRFEEKLVADLNKEGVHVSLQGITDYNDFREMKDLWKSSNNPEADLKEKTAAYVKTMMEEYERPEALKVNRKIKPY